MPTPPEQINLEDLEKQAEALLDKKIYDYIAGGAGSEEGVKNNQKAFLDYLIVPRLLQGISDTNTSLEIFGKKISSPILFGPCAFHKLVCRQGELATARAAEKVKTIMTLSTMSSYTIEEVATSSNAIKWFQLYIFKNRDLTQTLLKRAEKSGYEAIVITIDVPAMGMRLRDIRNKFALPNTVEAANFRETGLSSLSIKTQGSSIKDHTDRQFESNLNWNIIDWIRSITKLPIIIKGILNPADAREALKHSIAGIIVSNHGGRQIDSSIPAINALPDIAQIVQNRMPLFVDGGIRSGEDIFKAIALGASAVMIARPIMWALSLYEEEGVISLFQNLQKELALTMLLTGCSSLNVIKERGLSLLEGPGIVALKLSLLEKKISQLLEIENLPNSRHLSIFKSRL